jgi:SNF2 family DNA or RNA helicase
LTKSLEPGFEKHCVDCAEISQKASVKQEAGMPDSSSKIRKLLELLHGVEERSGKKEKTIVFSQFTSFLNLIEPFLRAKGINFVRCEWIDLPSLELISRRWCDAER